ncbi:unnamed protein product [Arctogadus glacialis]
MASEGSRRDGELSRGSIPLDIDDVQLLLQGEDGPFCGWTRFIHINQIPYISHFTAGVMVDLPSGATWSEVDLPFKTAFISGDLESKVEQVQIQKRTFTNWVNAQLAKRKPPCMVGELFSDFCDGSRLLDLLEVMSGQRMSRERGRGIFQHRSNIETALNFLKSKSIKLVNINIPDIIDGKPSIILGLIWTIILQYHIEELASSLSFSSRQSSMESLASLDTRSSLSSFSSADGSLSGASPRSSPLPGRRASPLHNRFKVSAKKALLLWVREQCHKAGYTLTVKDFKASWRSGVVFLAILYSLRPDLVDLSKARNRSNLQNLEEAFGLAQRELRIPRLLEPCDVDVRDPEEKSIMTYVSQFLQYSRDLPIPEEGVQYLMPPKTHSPINLPVHYTPAVSDSPLRQATPNQKAQEVTCWLLQAYEELLEGWDSTEGESYAERYHVFQTFLVSFNEQRRPVMPLLTAMKRSVKVSEEQRALREAWDALAEKLREYKVQLDVGLPAPLTPVGVWLLRAEGALTDQEPDPLDPGRAAQQARHSQELLNACLEEMPQQVRNFQMFQNVDESGNLLVPTDKLDEMKRRFTSVRVTAKYHGIKLEYQEQRHTVLELLARVRPKLRSWRRPYVSQESVRVLLQEWHELVNEQQLPSLLEAALQKLKHVSGKYSSKSALAADYGQVKQQVEEVEEESQELQEGVAGVKSSLVRVLSAWESFSDTLSSLMAWLEQGGLARPPQVSSEAMSEWSSRQTHLNQVGEFLMEVSDPQTTRTLADDLRRINQRWARFLQATPAVDESEAARPASPPDLQVLIRDAMLILKEPLETLSGPLQTYRKRIQFMLKKMRDVDLETEDFPELSADQRQKLTQAIPEVLQTLSEAEQVCIELRQSVCGLDGRLAELLHWDVEARELYQVLKARERRPQRAQDPRARVFISRGLQLEGQVVTEEQDLQVMVMMSQKNSPVQYVHASAMQHRVRAAVAQSQEVVGMLSSLGARRDRSQSPPEDRTPQTKTFVAREGEPVEKRARVLSIAPPLTQQKAPEPRAEPRGLQQQQVPTIVVQEYREKAKLSSPPLPYSYAQAMEQQDVPQQKPPVHPEAPIQKHMGARAKELPEATPQPPSQQDEQKKPLSQKELQSRKAQGRKNRPWLQKKPSDEQDAAVVSDQARGAQEIPSTDLPIKSPTSPPTEVPPSAQAPAQVYVPAPALVFPSTQASSSPQPATSAQVQTHPEKDSGSLAPVPVDSQLKRAQTSQLESQAETMKQTKPEQTKQQQRQPQQKQPAQQPQPQKQPQQDVQPKKDVQPQPAATAKVQTTVQGPRPQSETQHPRDLRLHCLSQDSLKLQAKPMLWRPCRPRPQPMANTFSRVHLTLNLSCNLLLISLPQLRHYPTSKRQLNSRFTLARAHRLGLQSEYHLQCRHILQCRLLHFLNRQCSLRFTWQDIPKVNLHNSSGSRDRSNRFSVIHSGGSLSPKPSRRTRFSPL